jgi:surfeit locus 1 family protein
MASLQSYDIPTTDTERLTSLRELPRLLVSRRWRWVTLGAIIIASGLLSLGFWQLDRLGERRAHNALLESRLNAPPIELTGQPLDPESHEFRRVIVRGEYDHANEVLLRSRSLNGMPGSDVLTPLRIAGSEETVLVNRGWAPLLDFQGDQLSQYQQTGPVELEGIVRLSQPQRSMITPPDRIPEGGRLIPWFRADVERIGSQIPYPLLPFYVEQTSPRASDAVPVPHPDLDTQDQGPHLGYAIQWFSFALIGLGGYAALVLQHAEQQRRRTTDDGRRTTDDA